MGTWTMWGSLRQVRIGRLGLVEVISIFQPCIIVFLRGERDFVAHMTGALKGRRSAHGSQRLCMSS